MPLDSLSAEQAITEYLNQDDLFKKELRRRSGKASQESMELLEGFSILPKVVENPDWVDEWIKREERKRRTKKLKTTGTPGKRD